MVYSIVNPSSPLQELAYPACIAGQRKGSLAEEKAPTYLGKQTSGRMYQARTQDALEHKLHMTCLEDKHKYEFCRLSHLTENQSRLCLQPLGYTEKFPRNCCDVGGVTSPPPWLALPSTLLR